ARQRERSAKQKAGATGKGAGFAKGRSQDRPYSGHDQNCSRNSIDRMRGPRSLVYWPVLAVTFWPVAGLNWKPLATPLYSVWLKTLNASKRSFNWRFSLKSGIERVNAASKFSQPGPYRMPAPPPALPIVPTAGCANAFGLKASLWFGTDGFEGAGMLAVGSPITSMRAPSLAEPVILRLLVVLKPGVNG